MGTVIRTELFKPPPFLERRFKAVVEDGSAHKKGACKPQLPGDPMLDKLEFWLLLARERHFGRPAEAAGVTQPTFSSAMKTGGSSGRVRARQALSTAARRARCLCPPAMAALARLRRDWRHRSWPRLQRERGSWESEGRQDERKPCRRATTTTPWDCLAGRIPVRDPAPFSVPRLSSAMPSISSQLRQSTRNADTSSANLLTLPEQTGIVHQAACRRGLTSPALDHPHLMKESATCAIALST
jgi:hypothetical protein